MPTHLIFTPEQAERIKHTINIECPTCGSTRWIENHTQDKLLYGFYCLSCDYKMPHTVLDDLSDTIIGGIKYDQEKPIAGIIQDFGRALTQVSKLATFGAGKYRRGSWKHVENGYERYTDALARHFLQEGYESVDSETQIEHDVAVAWNALARLELRLSKK